MYASAPATFSETCVSVSSRSKTIVKRPGYTAGTPGIPRLTAAGQLRALELGFEDRLVRGLAHGLYVFDRREGFEQVVLRAFGVLRDRVEAQVVLQVLHVVGLRLELLPLLEVALALLENTRVLRTDGLLDQSVDLFLRQVQLDVCCSAQRTFESGSQVARRILRARLRGCVVSFYVGVREQ